MQKDADSDTLVLMSDQAFYAVERYLREHYPDDDWAMVRDGSAVAYVADSERVRINVVGTDYHVKLIRRCPQTETDDGKCAEDVLKFIVFDQYGLDRIFKFLPDADNWPTWSCAFHRGDRVGRTDVE